MRLNKFSLDSRLRGNDKIRAGMRLRRLSIRVKDDFIFGYSADG